MGESESPQPQEQPRRPGWWGRKSKGKKTLWVLGGVVVVIVIIAVVAGATGGGSTSTTSTIAPVADAATGSTATPAPVTTTTAAVTTTGSAAATTTTTTLVTTTTAAPSTTSSTEATTTTAALQTYSDGTYKVGSDIPAGLYKSTSDSGAGYWEITKDASGSLDSIVANANVTGQFYVQVKAGQFLNLDGLTIAKASALKSEKPLSTDISDGMYLVGVDIVAGRYKGTPNSDSGYWEISRDATGTMSSIVSNDNVSGQFYVDVKTGQYLTLDGVSISLSK